MLYGLCKLSSQLRHVVVYRMMPFLFYRFLCCYYYYYYLHSSWHNYSALSPAYHLCKSSQTRTFCQYHLLELSVPSELLQSGLVAPLAINSLHSWDFFPLPSQVAFTFLEGPYFLSPTPPSWFLPMFCRPYLLVTSKGGIHGNWNFGNS